MQLMPWPNSQSEYSLFLLFAGHNERLLGMKCLQLHLSVVYPLVQAGILSQFCLQWDLLNPGLPHMRRVFQSPATG